MKNSNPISTSEFNLAAFLLSKDCKLARLDRSNPKRVRFIFSQVPQTLINAFWSNDEVKVSDFINAQRALKQKIFADTY